jgi:hypothetical protein
MAGIKQKFIDSEYSRVHVDNSHCIHYEVIILFPNERVETKRIRPECLRYGTAKFEKSFAVDVAGPILIVKIFRNPAEPIPPFFRPAHRLLRGYAKKTGDPDGLRV